MASLSEKVEAELEQMERAMRELPAARRVAVLSVLELGGTGSLLSSLYHGAENILKQNLLTLGAALPKGAAWHRDLLQSACEHGIISSQMRDSLAPYLTDRIGNISELRPYFPLFGKAKGEQITFTPPP